MFVFLCVYLSPGQTRKHCCRNIRDSRCFLECIPFCPPVETMLRKQILLPRKQECFLSSSETFDVSQVRFLSRKHCFPVLPPWEHWQETMLISSNKSKQKINKYL